MSSGLLGEPLAGRVTVVSGAGRGIGRAIALGFADAGSSVACLDIDDDTVSETARIIVERHGDGRGWGARCDVTVWEDVQRSLVDVRAALGEVDVVVANAGGPRGQSRPFLELDVPAWTEMLDRNLTGAFFTGLVYGGSMALRGSGSIVLVASQLSTVVRAGLSHYAVAKAGVAQLVRAMAVELAPKGIRVNGLAPGPTETPGTTELFGRPGVREKLVDLLPLGRVARPEDMVGPAVFLASDAAGYVTGHILFADGGYTLT